MNKRAIIFFVIILFIILLIYSLNNLSLINEISKTNTKNIQINNNSILFDSLSLREKIAQMIIVRGDDNSEIEITNLNPGGIFLDRQNSKEDYKHSIEQYQNNSRIKLFVSTDLEGAWNPFSSFLKIKSFSSIETSDEAYLMGLFHGETLKSMGYNINFAPVAEYSDEIYGGRVFLGSNKEVKEKISFYIKGLQKNVFGTCKHYPGKGMINNLHFRSDKQEIKKEDLELFYECIDNNISAIMIGHQKVTGIIDSKDKPSSVSEEVISTLQEFQGLIISDEVNMIGLRSYYKNKEDMYADLINSGENLILDFRLGQKDFYTLVLNLEKLAKEGKISEEKINKSVKKILTMKGYIIQ